jgi:RND family efflux transporter MFP subunit
MSKSKILSLCVLCFATALPLVAENITVPVAAPERQDIYRWVTAPATTRANQEVLLNAKIAGYLTAITVDRGSPVTAGMHIATVEAPEMNADVLRLRAELEVAKAEHARLMAARAKAPDLIVPRDVDEADGRVRVAAANLERMETLMSFGRVTAPFAGIVTGRWADPGAYIAVPTGGGKNGALVTIADIATVRVLVPVPEKEAPFVKVGNPVVITFDALTEPIKATVSRHGHMVDSQSGTLAVEVDVANAALTLMPGMFARVRLGSEMHGKVLTVPLSSVLTEGKVTSVFTIAGGIAKKVAVKVGLNDGTRIELVTGVTETDSVASIITGLADGKAVTVAAKP